MIIFRKIKNKSIILLYALNLIAFNLRIQNGRHAQTIGPVIMSGRYFRVFVLFVYQYFSHSKRGYS